MNTVLLAEAAQVVFRALAPLLSGAPTADVAPELAAAAAQVAARLAAGPKGAAALAFFRADPQDTAAGPLVEAQIAAGFKDAPEELFAIARAVAALHPAAHPAAHPAPTVAGGNGQVATPPPALSADGVHFTPGHALLIGVGAYQDPRLVVAGGTTGNDARALAALLRDPLRAAYPTDQVQVLVDSKATRGAILDSLEALAHRLADHPDATALVFFAGHGEALGSGYGLLPYDADPDDLAGTSVTADLFHRRIAKIRGAARRLLVVLNCCHAGGVGDMVLGAPAALSGAAPPPEFYRPLAVGSGQVVISSSRPDQFSGARSSVDPAHTTFGTHLLGGLQGGAPGAGPGIGVFELFTYLRLHVPADAPALPQEPLFYASQLDDNIAVALRPPAAPATLGAPGADEALIARLVELELCLEAGYDAGLAAERDAVLARLGS